MVIASSSISGLEERADVRKKIVLSSLSVSYSKVNEIPVDTSKFSACST